MAVSTFKYCDQDFFRSIYPDYGKHLARVHIHGFTQVSGDQWEVSGIGTTPAQVFFDGVEGIKETSAANVGVATEWYYDTETDKLTIFTATASDNPNDDEYIEAGDDKDTFVDQHLVNASMQLNNMLDARFPRPIPKGFQHSSDPANDIPEYDYILKLMAAKIAAVNMIRAGDPTSEIADSFWSEVTNPEEMGLVDKLNKGEYKLSFEIDKTDDSGDVIEVTKAGTMSLVETYGEWTGAIYDRVQVICSTTGGAYGTAKVDVKVSGSDQLYGTTISDVIVTGGLQHIANGLYVRFEGASMNVSDRWDVVVRRSGLKESNTNVYTVGLYK